MSNSGAVTPGDGAGKPAMLDVACSKCDRRGRLSIAKLIAEHGADMRLPDLRAGDCPRVRAASFNDRCAVHYPRLAEVPLAISSLVETRMGLLWGPFSETPLEIVAGH